MPRGACRFASGILQCERHVRFTPKAEFGAKADARFGPKAFATLGDRAALGQKQTCAAQKTMSALRMTSIRY